MTQLPPCVLAALSAGAAALLGVAVAAPPKGRAGPPPRAEVYKTVGETKLRLFLYGPEAHSPQDRRPAIVFFFGGGWVGGSPRQFEPHARYFASRGLVAITVEYRVRSRHGVSPFQCVADAKSALRYLRANAERLGIDPDRLVAAGGSAGGHLAACTALVPGFDDPQDDQDVSCVPNALVLFNPVVDTTATGFGARRLGEKARALSPVHHVKAGAPPTILFHGTADTTVPFENVERFRDRMQAAGCRCELVPFEGEKHAFFNYGRKGNKLYVATVRRADRFLASLGYLEGEPTVDE